MVTSQVIAAFATKLANLAQEGKPYQLVDVVSGKSVIAKGTGYKLQIFQVAGVNYLPQDVLDTRNKFKRYIISSINDGV